MAQKTEFKVGVFIIITTLLIMAAIGYVAYKKDVFSKVYTYTLSSKTGENITEGTPVVFWGFNIGQVSKMELTDSGVLVRIKIPERNNRVIRAGSRFVLEKPLLSSSRIIVYTDDLNALPLQTTAVPELTVSDDINELIRRVQTIAEKIDRIAGNITTISGKMADPQGDIERILKNIETVTSRLAEKETLAEMLTGNKESVKSIQKIIDNAGDVTANADLLIKRIDALAAKTDDEINGKDGIFSLVRQILNDLLAKLAKIEVTIDNINSIGNEAADATKDLAALRGDIDETVMSIKILVDDLDRIIPFKEESGIDLP
jgi:phospholipid/cholesterol/gamma-HCH transport system substrate-binding protein